MIHFLTLFSVNFDAILASHFVNHYKNLELDFYTVYLHLSQDEEKNKIVKNIMLEGGFIVVEVPVNATAKNLDKKHPGIRPDGNFEVEYWPGAIKMELFTAYAKNIPEKDFIIAADADEFQDWERPPSAYIMEGCDAVCGKVMDRFNDTLADPEVTDDLNTFYPHTFPNISRIWKPNNPHHYDKVVMFRAGMKMDFTGCHYLPEVRKKALKVAEDLVQVNHYKWRPNVQARLRIRFNYTDPERESIEGFFSPGANSYKEIMRRKTIIFCAPDKKIGDFVLKLPMLKELLRYFPGANVIGVGVPDIMELAICLGLVNKCLPWNEFLSEKTPIHGADIALMLADGMDVYAERILKKYGCKLINQKFNCMKYPENMPLIFRYYEVLKAFDIIQKPKKHGLADLLTDVENVPESRTLIHPGSAEGFKRLPLEHFVKLFQELAQDGERPLIVLGPEEKIPMEKVFTDEGIEVWRPKSLAALADGIKNANAYFGHDSGGTHLSALMDIPTYFLYAQVPAKMWWPVLFENTVMCKSMDEAMEIRKKGKIKSAEIPALC